jgi:hypothetical protein
MMKAYPSIPKTIKSSGIFWVFDKADGSNLRFEWNRKQGWYKFGSRTRLIDSTDPTLGPAIPLFISTLGEGIEKVARDNKWESVVAFAEYWGASSFAGKHEISEPHYLSLFDVAPFKKGMLGPEQFLEFFAHLPHAPLLGQFEWNLDFVECIRQDALPGITFEGVVGKRGEGHQVEMVKAKTQKWIDRVRLLYSPEDAELLINS